MDAVATRAEELYREHSTELHAATDRLFAALMGVQWIGGIAAALLLSPKAWRGSQMSTHEHVWAATILGGLLASLPWYMCSTIPANR